MDITKGLPAFAGQRVKHIQGFCKLLCLLALWKVQDHTQHIQIAVTSHNSLHLPQSIWEQNAGVMFSVLHD